MSCGPFNMSRQLFTMGYEGTDIRTFVANLLANSIDCILDVRAIAFSRKPGFSKTALARNLKNANIDYVHLPDLGTPKPIRTKLKSTQDYSNFFKTMDAHLAEKQDAIEFAYEYVNQHTCCLLCFERLAAQCHRKIVARKIKARDGNGLQIKHI
jgi:uncharacterized protein (DUF488 family)